MGILPASAATPLQYLAAKLDAIHPETAPAFIASYEVSGTEGHDLADANAAYTYDQALALLAFLSSGDVAHARRIGDALVWAQAHDRFYHDGRLRNAYAAGVVDATPVKMPGYYDKAKGQWIEDGYQVGAATGNQAWAGIALLRLSDATGDKRYAAAAHAIGRFLLDHVGADGGFRGGFEAFEPNAQTLTWKSTEHNADALAFLRLLEKAYPGEDFGRAGDQVRAFLESMWLGDHYATGTMTDGKTVNAGYSSLDAQTFTILSLDSPLSDGRGRPANGRAGEGKPAQDPHPSPLPSGRGDNPDKAMAWLDRTHSVPGGFDYSDARAGIWPEGTMQAALVYKLLGNGHKAQVLIDAQTKLLTPDGGLYAVEGIGGAPLDRLETKLKLGNGEGVEWYYYRRPHIAPVAWMVMAENGYNPLAAL